MKFLIGQRVLLHNEIGTVVKPENDNYPNNEKGVWVFSPLQGFPSYYSTDNVKPLPNGQL